MGIRPCGGEAPGGERMVGMGGCLWGLGASLRGSLCTWVGGTGIPHIEVATSRALSFATGINTRSPCAQLMDLSTHWVATCPPDAVHDPGWWCGARPHIRVVDGRSQTSPLFRTWAFAT